MKISCEELYIVWEAWNKDDNPLDNPFVIQYQTVLGETRKILVTDIETDTDHNCYLVKGVNHHFARVRRFIRLDYEFDIESDGLFVLNGCW